MAYKNGVAFVFPGQGSQYVGMGEELLEAYPIVRETFGRANEILGVDYLETCLNGPVDKLNDTGNTQVCIYILSYAIYKIIEDTGFKPQVIAGHSLGEYSALSAANALKFSDGLQIVAKRAELMSKAAAKYPGRMLALLGADMRAVEDIVSDLSNRGTISVANYNCPGQIVVSVEAGLADLATDALSMSAAKKVVMLPVSGAFHSTMMQAAEDDFRAFLDGYIFLGADIPVVPNTLAHPVIDAVELRNALQTQISSSVKWQQSVEQMIGLGIKTFVEVGPGQVLSKIIKRIDKQVEVFATENPPLLAKAIDRLKKA
ncbi:MAG: [acyl-carrier-protein] S-malonyltransferase [Candidatus Aquicultor secundus]|uniref:Malonyl CoA-acyl carrier protein transacylase n=1 Tax=Candidatus Aquicultor secundus TaxID=1973895 RepID=A0A2M7T5W1_9ACTN|nr:ACP S-malonyltransferase [Candidatus Aquicultor secundus]NCO65214.1 ACP S-malonyltransferase [Solirubrobacter sp.]PIU26521.1 MAG: [acyl-carrier-protein] S-malonyltransferase [Candidatus Aquicultor secundus]PIW23002.1 MAG: [acyl-carrier-protein] S-malonyltransferase [Candidatus Aquicultor secundus]PIX51846.1 MAG: [acyl-carrier-protein] S-malonyltransferase [Candidatus Aquicultor secundus]PIY42206.1 MAG: [acyl-carrier-protein] S-malonyltransferase [Candidatus Aquicultor secundus]